MTEIRRKEHMAELASGVRFKKTFKERREVSYVCEFVEEKMDNII